MNKCFKLYANCIAVKGDKRSVICDLQMGKITFIPNSLHEILTVHCNKTIAEIFAAYDSQYQETINEYFDFLIKKELGFYTEKPELFPDLPLEWEEPATITNAIIDTDDNSQHNYSQIFKELNNLGCQSLQLRFYNELNSKELERILELLKVRKIRSVEIIVKYNNDYTPANLEIIVEKYLRISSIVVHSATQNKIVKHEVTKNWAAIVYSKQRIETASSCGEISPRYFSVHVKTFTESIHYNSCLNRKISIDVEGNIKNCPSMEKSYGKYPEITLREAINCEGFKAIWHITKDKIEGCNVCEFRYICTDCRAFMPYGCNSKPTKCKYNPHTAIWNN